MRKKLSKLFVFLFCALLCIGVTDVVSNADADGTFADFEDDDLNDINMNISDIDIDREEACLVVQYTSSKTCSVYGEVWDDAGENLLFSVHSYGYAENNEVRLELDLKILPDYFLLKAYAIEEATDTKTEEFENFYYTKAFHDIKNLTIVNFDPARTTVLGNNDFGVFAKDTVIIRKNGSKNLLDETRASEGIYTISATDFNALNLKPGVSLAYYSGDQLKLVTKIGSILNVSQSRISFSTGDLHLEEVFEYLKVDTSDDELYCTVMPETCEEGVTYNGTSNAQWGQDEISAMEVRHVKTSLGASQQYSISKKLLSNNGKEIKISGNIDLILEIPLEIYVYGDRSYIRSGASINSNISLSVSGSWEGKLQLAKVICPFANGLFSVEMIPYSFVTVTGEVSVGVTASASIDTRADSNGYKILSRTGDVPSFDCQLSGSCFFGVWWETSLYWNLPREHLMEFDIKAGPEVTASLIHAKPVNEQNSGDHTCQNCIDGDGYLALNLSAEVSAFKKKIESETKITLKGLDFWYSLDKRKGGIGECPYVRGGMIDDETGGGTGGQDEIPNPENLPIRYGFSVCGYKYNGVLYVLGWDGTCEAIDIYDQTLSDIVFPSKIKCGVGGWDSDGNKCLYVGTYTLEEIFLPEKSLERVTIPEGVKKIYFRDCRNLKKITIPGSVTSLRGTFQDCTSLDEITIPGSVTSLNYAFEGCTSLREITIPESVTSLFRTFEGCTSLREITIPGSVTSLPETFRGCTSLSKITIPGSVTSLPATFMDCTSLDEITIPGSVTSLDSAFEGCTSLGKITIPESVTSIGDSAFSGCTSLGKIVIPESVTSIGRSAFKGCTSLGEITIPESVTSIGDSAFEGCTSLGKITIPESVTSIGWFAFEGCTSLGEITIPESVTSIEYAFSQCDELTDIYYGGTKEQWENVLDFGSKAQLDASRVVIHFNSQKSSIDLTVNGNMLSASISVSNPSEYGIIGTATESLTLNTPGRIRIGFAKLNNHTFSLGDLRPGYYRAYVIYTDASGRKQTAYSKTVKID